MRFGFLGSATASMRTAVGLDVKGRWLIYCLETLVAAAFVLSALLLTERTSLAPAAFIVAGGCWVAGEVIPALLGRLGVRPVASDSPVIQFSPTTLFFAVVAATFTVHALDAVFQAPAKFNPNAPEALPGLATNFAPYYLVLLACVVLFVTWYGRVREREVEAGVAVLVVYSSVVFEIMLRTAGSGAAPSSGTLSMPLLWGTLLVLLVLWLSDRARNRAEWWWTPFGGAVLALVVAAVLSTVTSVYVHASLLMLSRVAAFALLFWLVANVTKGVPQIRLFWLAIVGPVMGVALVIVLKLWELNREMGWDFVLAHRYQISGVAGTNPLGLSLAVVTLLIVGAILVLRSWWQRAALGSLLVIAVPAFLAAHSPTSLVALGGALVGLLLLRFGRGVVQRSPRRLGWSAAAALAAAALIVLLVQVPNPYTGKVIGDVRDPSTGRSARPLAWELSFSAFAHNPVLGVGLHNYYARTRYVDDFPSETMTRVRERRLLLGGNVEPWKTFVSFHPHNAYLAIMEGTGILGLLALGWLGISLAGETWRVFKGAQGSPAWWATAVPLAGVGLVLAWSFFAQGEDVTLVGLPFWALLGLLAGAGRLLDSSDSVRDVGQPGTWRRHAGWPSRLRLGSIPGIGRVAVQRFRLMPLLAITVGLVYVALVARPVAAEILVHESEESQSTEKSRALDLARWARRLDPWNAAYLERVSDAYLRAGRLRDAIRTQEDVTRARRYFAPDHVRLGWLYWLANSPGKALVQFQRAAEFDRWDTTGGNVYMGLALAYVNANQYERATTTFALGFQLSPSLVTDDMWVRDEAGLDKYLDPVYLERGEERVPEDLQRIIRRQLGLRVRKPAPHEPDQAFDLRLSTIFDAMYRDYQVMISTDRNRASAIIADLGDLALKAGMLQSAVEFFEELKSVRGDQSSVHYDLGLAHAASGDAARAEQEFRAAVSIGEAAPEYDLRVPFGHYQLGVLALEAVPIDARTAEEEFQAALDAYRWDFMPNLYTYLAVAKELQGDHEGAEEALGKELFLRGIDSER